MRDLARHGDLLSGASGPLHRVEAVASAHLEGIDVHHETVALAERGFGDDQGAHDVLAGMAALGRAGELADGPLTPTVLADVRRVLSGDARVTRLTDRGADGHVRTGPGRMTGHGAADGPVAPMLDDLCAFCARDDVPTLVQAGVALVQFEMIRPYADGNGRVGRALVAALLRRRGLARTVLPPLSLALATSGDRYVEGLAAFRAGRVADWLSFFVDAVCRAARAAEELAAGVHELQSRWTRMARHPRLDSAAAALIQRLPEAPIIDLAAGRMLTGVSSQATLAGIDRLARAGVLREITGRRRDRLWEGRGMIALLDTFGTGAAAASA